MAKLSLLIASLTHDRTHRRSPDPPRAHGVAGQAMRRPDSRPRSRRQHPANHAHRAQSEARVDPGVRVERPGARDGSGAVLGVGGGSGDESHLPFGVLHDA